MHPFVRSTEEEINKQINRELFAHYTYLSMVRLKWLKKRAKSVYSSVRYSGITVIKSMPAQKICPGASNAEHKLSPRNITLLLLSVTTISPFRATGHIRPLYKECRIIFWLLFETSFESVLLTSSSTRNVIYHSSNLLLYFSDTNLPSNLELYVRNSNCFGNPSWKQAP